MHVVKIAETFECSIENIWHLVTDLHNQLWRTGLEKVNVIDSSHFIEYDKSGFCTEFNITNKVENKVYEFDLRNDNIEGHWTGQFEIINDNLVKIEFTEAIEVKKKVMNLIIKPYLRKQQKQYIQDLKKVLK